MKHVSLFIVLSFFVACEFQQEEKTKPSEKNQPEDKKTSIRFQPVEQLATDFKFTEGPAPDENGNVYFTDIPEAKIYIWTTSNDLELFRENSGGANGLFFDTSQTLYTCEMYKGQVSTTSSNGEYKVMASTFDGKKLNQPNDVWVHPNGNVYFTDPYYGAEEDKIPQDGMHVYMIKKLDNSITRVTNDLVRPNGLIGTPDGKYLYITDQSGNKTFRYDIEEDGSLTQKSLFVNVGGDGMTIDKQGNIYLTTNEKMAVEIYSPKGSLLISIPIPEQPSNVSFGGENRNELYITARTSLYRVIVSEKGAY